MLLNVLELGGSFDHKIVYSLVLGSCFANRLPHSAASLDMPEFKEVGQCRCFIRVGRPVERNLDSFDSQ